MGGNSNIIFLQCHPVLQQKQAAELDLSTEVATRLNLVDKETPAVSLPDAYSAHTAHARHSDEDVPRLTKVRCSEVKCSQSWKKAWIQFHVFIVCVYVGNDSGGELCSGAE